MECPKCESDLITVSSSRELGVSIITCDDCDFSLQENMNEDDLIEKWDKPDKRVDS